MYPNNPPEKTISSSTTNYSSQFHSEINVNREANVSNYGGREGVTSWSTVPPPPPISGLIRQSSSPAAFYHQHLISDSGISHTNEGGHERYDNPQALASSSKNNKSRFTSNQLSFANYDSINYDARQLSSARSLKKASTSSTSSSSQHFTISPWEEENSIRFDEPYDSQVHKLMIGSGSNLNNVSAEDTVGWGIRAKRGFATDPRSIAERERRTRINCKLKTLQELLPNIDKQASYAEMLDLAVEHVKVLQCQIQELNEELNKCKCGCINHNK